MSSQGAALKHARSQVFIAFYQAFVIFDQDFVTLYQDFLQGSSRLYSCCHRPVREASQYK